MRPMAQLNDPAPLPSSIYPTPLLCTPRSAPARPPALKSPDLPEGEEMMNHMRRRFVNIVAEKMMNHLRRRFVNIVAENCRSATCSLHRLKSEHIFYPSTAMAEAEAAKPALISNLGSLPEPTFSFQPEPRLKRWDQLFALVNPRTSESRILWSSPEAVTFIYDADTNCSHAVPSNLTHKGNNPIAISVARPDDAEQEDLYVMSSRASCPSFQVLKLGGRIYESPWVRSLRHKPWQWDSFPPPPLPNGFIITSHTVLDDGVTICVTAYSPCDLIAADHGGEEATAVTYMFDTLEGRQWRPATGGLLDLPFAGGAEYLPDHKLWLGLCQEAHHLCASDLFSAALKPPTPKHLWNIVEMPEEWKPIKAGLLNLGDNRFCIAKLMVELMGDENEDTGRSLALLTGVEMLRGEDGLVRMVRHKSLSYIFRKENIKWVL